MQIELKRQDVNAGALAAEALTCHFAPRDNKTGKTARCCGKFRSIGECAGSFFV